MAKWDESMEQTFEFYIVDPNTWRDQAPLTTVKSCTITRDSEVDTLGSATFDIVESVGECYLRVYLITVQNGVRERHPLGTFLVQTPTSTFDGKTRNVSMDAYTPLIELKEKQPDIGYFVPKSRCYKVLCEDGVYKDTLEEVLYRPVQLVEGAKTLLGRPVYKYIDGSEYVCRPESVTDIVYRIMLDKVRAPIIKTPNEVELGYDFVAESNETWFSYLKSLLASVNYLFELDPLGRITFVPYRDYTAMRHTWTYDDGNSSILYPEITMDHDLYGVPNVVEVMYFDGRETHYAIAENTDPNSPTSIPARGRRIVHRVTDPDLVGVPGTDEEDIVEVTYSDGTQKRYAKMVYDYAKRVLKNLSTIEYKITYTHGYCPTKVGDCVMLNYSRSGLTNVKAKVISQSIKCETGCSVTETAVFTKKLWG